MSPTELPSIRRRSGLQGRHVLLSILGFFGVIFTVNGVLIYYAVATHSGVVAQEPYRKGLTYNVRIAADERQKALHWSADVETDTEGRVTLKLTHAGGGPVVNLAVKGVLGRPSAQRDDVALAFAESSPGTYVAVIGPKMPGVWLVNVEARESGSPVSSDPIFRIRRRLWLQP